MSQLALLSDDSSLNPSPAPTLDPMPRPEGKCLWGVDWGSGYFHVCRADETPSQDGEQPLSYRMLPPKDFLALPFCQPGDCVVIEMAHVVPRASESKVSKAQPLIHSEVLQLAETAAAKGCEIRVWPQGMTPKARDHFYGHINESKRKRDCIDAHTVALAANRYGTERLQRLSTNAPGQWSELQAWAFAQKEDMNNMLNAWQVSYRRGQNCFELLFNVHMSQRILSRVSKIEDRQLREDCHSEFLSSKRLSSRAEAEANNTVALWAALISYSAQPRMFQGKPLGINNTMRYLLGQKPAHFRGGVARAKLMHYGLKSFLRRHEIIAVGDGIIEYDHNSERYQKFRQLKARWRHAMKQSLFILRDAYNEGAGTFP